MGTLGDKGAIAQALAGQIEAEHEAADAEDAQLALFAAPATEAGRKKAGPLAARGPGRPPGARNRRTEHTLAFLRARHRDPRVVLLEIAGANVHDLAGLLGCSAHEALQEKRLAAIGVLPYYAARLTPEVLQQFNGVFLTINEGRIAGAGGGGVGASALVLEKMQYQEVNDDAGGDVGQADVGRNGESTDDAA